MRRRSPLPLLTETLKEAPILALKGYDYFVHPITDGVPAITEPLLREVVGALQARLPAKVDRFLTPEAMGIPLASALTLATGKPFTVARKRPYGLPGEVAVAYTTGYSAGQLHVNGLVRGEHVVIVDDVVSTGGTMRALAEAVRRRDAKLAKVLTVISKAVDLGALGRDLGAPVEALVRLRVVGGRVQLEA